MKFKFLYPIILFVLIFNDYKSIAQTSTNSPYSMFGIGEVQQGGFGQSKGMGGTGIAMPSESSLSSINPASYQGLDSLSFLLETGFSGRQSVFETSRLRQVRNNFGMNYLAIGFKGKSWWAGSFGLAPLSSVGNNINITQPIEGSLTQNLNINVAGTGGVNKVYFGNSIKINKHLAIGINFSYLFGPLNQVQTTTYTTPNIGSVQTIQFSDKTYLSSLYLNYGVQYSFNISSKFKSTIGAIYSNKKEINLNHTSALIGPLGDTIQTTRNNYSTYTFPQSYGAGISVNYNGKLILTADYQTTKWTGSKPFSTPYQTILWPEYQPVGASMKFITSENYSVGMQFVPKDAYNSNFIQQIRYRAGAYFSNTYVQIQGRQLIDKGITAGLGVPVIKRRLYGNIAVGIGIHGVPGATINVINETYKTMMFSFTLMDFWFVKRQYN